MKIYQLAHDLLRHPGSIPAHIRRAVHAFEYAGLDYRLLRGYSFAPRSVCLILTDRCNLKCRMCDIGRGSDADVPGILRMLGSGIRQLEKQDWLDLIGDLAKFRPRPLVLLTGAEPLLYPSAPEIIAAAVAGGLSLHVTTNGTLLEQIGPRIAAVCRSRVPVDITVSLDGIGADHDEIRGVAGTFDRAIRGIRATVAAREARGSRFPEINLTCTIGAWNCDRLEAFVEWFLQNEVPVESITFNHLWFRDRAIVELHNRRFGGEFPVVEENSDGPAAGPVDMAAVQAALQRIRQRCAGTHLRIHQQPELQVLEAQRYYSDPCRPVYYDRCTAAWRNVAVTPRGNVILSPLCFLPPIGNLAGVSFRRLWNGVAARALRRRIRQEKLFPACSRCCMLFGSRPAWHKLVHWF